VPQFKLIRNWLFIFTLIITIITLNFTVAMANMWLYDDKSIFLQKASGALLFASIVYVAMNMIVMIFPHIMYGLPVDVKESLFVNNHQEGSQTKEDKKVDESITQDKGSTASSTVENKENPLLFSVEYLDKIEKALNGLLEQQQYLNPEFKLISIAEKLGLPPHHLTYYFNTILQLSFSDWRNKLRIEFVVNLMKEGHYSSLTLEALSIKAGFTTQSTFIRSFKTYTGQTPSEYIKSLGV
jgi:AraC-like DNA-binding protein